MEKHIKHSPIFDASVVDPFTTEKAIGFQNSCGGARNKLRNNSGVSKIGAEPVKIPISLLCLTVFSAASMTTAMLHPSPRLYWNVTPSVPVGLYWITAHEATRGDLIIAPPPDTVRAIADSRGYIPAKIPLLKRIAAVRGDDVCASQTRISINGKVVAQRLEKDQAGRAMPWWTGCRTLGNEVFLLLTDVPTSFDGRYFGPIPRASVIGKAKPLWTY